MVAGCLATAVLLSGLMLLLISFFSNEDHERLTGVILVAVAAIVPFVGTRQGEDR